MKHLWLIIFVFCLTLHPLFAQYVRHNEYSTEQQRRMQYALDDWISYMQSNDITSIAVGANYIYFGTRNGGILRYQAFQNFWDYPYTTSNGLASNQITDVVYDDGTGFLWAITSEDTCVFNPAQEEWIRKSEAHFWDYKFPKPVPPDSGNGAGQDILYPAQFLSQLPIYFANGGYTVTGDWKIMDENFQEFQITGFLHDHWGRVWFPIEDLGVGIGSYYTQRMDVFPYGLLNFDPWVLTYQADDLWIAGQGRPDDGHTGIVNWRNQDGGWYYYQARYIANLPSDNVVDIAVTGDSVWFATDYGLSLYDSRKERWKNFGVKDGLYSQEVTDLLVHGKTLWVATNNGLNSLHLTTGHITRIKDDNIKLATIYQVANQKDTIWVASNRGMFRYKPQAANWEPVDAPSVIQQVPTSAITGYDDEVWATSPGGVFWLNGKTKKWESFPQIGQELQGPFYDIAVNWKSVWVSTPEGLLKYDRQGKYWIIFTKDDGLLDNECHRLLLDGDYIWVANRSGITQFYWNNPNRID
jgi:ligand-binding sensor domain-containing protein